jgi:hypothetical protein
MMNKNKYFSKIMLAISITLLMVMVMIIFVTPSSANANVGGTYDYVIITTNYIVDNSEYLDFFIKMKENDGHTVKIVTESDFGGLTGQYPNDRADKIRQWLKDNYVSLGIQYVLLIGNPDPDSFKESGDSIGDIPMKMCYPRYFGVGEGSPTDLYYSDLDSEWDLDVDGYFHESLDYNNPTSPHPSINDDHFSVEWSGYVYIDHDKTEYTFRVLSDDGVILQIGSGVAINMPNKEGLSYQEWTGEMDAGLNWITLKLREQTGDAVCRLYWKTEVDEEDPCYIKNDIIPSDKLYSTMSTSGGLNAEYFNNEDWEGPADWATVDPEVDFIWGTGDIGTSDPDYDPEVYVGRIPVYNNDYEQLDKILRKIINYETDPGDISWRESILLPMVEMNDTTFSGGLGEAIKTDVADYCGYSYYRIYEPEDAGFSPELIPPTIENVGDEWENGYGMVTWHTHGGEEGAAYVMDTANVGALDDTKPSFTMQASCHNAYPENPDNLAYSLLKHGAIATIAGTRMTTFQYGDYAYTDFNPVEYMNHQIAYYYTLYVMRYNMPAGVAYSEVVKYHKAPNANAIEFNLYGDPECQLFTVTPNEFPTADANGPYTGDEGSPIPFDASGSVDPEAMPMEYRWDFDGDDTWDTDWSTSPTAEYTWGDDYSGTVKLEVRDEIGKTDITTTTVTIQNVAPTATFDTLGQPNPQFILPYQELTFTGAFTDPGWEDTHTATWDFGDTTVIAGNVTEENDEPDSAGTITGEHSYAAPGTYTVTLTVTDDEGDIDTATTTVVIVTALEALQDLDDYIQNTANEDYKAPANARKKAFSSKFEAIYKILDTENYLGLIKRLNQDIREKCDGLIDGDPIDDWIIDEVEQAHICQKIDDISDYIDYLLNN